MLIQTIPLPNLKDAEVTDRMILGALEMDYLDGFGLIELQYC
jgi:hypothetical protein